MGATSGGSEGTDGARVAGSTAADEFGWFAFMPGFLQICAF
jgi:hypothetical protein